jgi:hypothetical protein
MRAFNNDPVLRRDLLEEIKKHQDMDLLIQGSYEQDGKYCAVGCAIQSLNVKRNKDYAHNDHIALAKELNIDPALFYLQDKIFENLKKEDAFKFPYQFTESIKSGADTSLVTPKFIVYLLIDEKHGVYQYADEQGKKVITQIAELYQRKINGEYIDIGQFTDAARAAADAAADAAARAAADAARAAADAAARAAADAAAYAAYAAADAARAAADAAARAAADAAAYAAYAETWISHRDKLLELLKACN